MHPVVVAAFRSQAEAAMAKASLLSSGITAAISPRDETVERWCPDAFSDGFDVITDEVDGERAIALLRHIWPDEIEVEAESVERCPSCGSADIATLPRLVIFIVLAVVLITTGAIVDQRDLFLLATGIVGAALLVTPNRRCRSCGERWRRKWQ